AGYVTSPDAASIATAIEDFYRNNREEEFSSYVLSEKGKFSWETFVNGILSLYEKIIA
ncbi:MAG: glycosyl transferase family 1, partial [Bacteroidia bacterium]|nr:glycosyl transferase family 1 [Bacteroidia bacterium]